MPGPLLFTVYALAIARITRLATTDKIFERPRNAIQIWLLDHEHNQLWYLTGCPWCASMWIALVAAPLIYAYPQSPWLVIPAMALAYSEITGLLASADKE